MGWELLSLFGVPNEITWVIQGAYSILLARAIIGYLPAISGTIHALTSLGRAGAGVAGAAGGAVGGAVGGLNHAGITDDPGVAAKFFKFFGSGTKS